MRRTPPQSPGKARGLPALSWHQGQVPRVWHRPTMIVRKFRNLGLPWSPPSTWRPLAWGMSGGGLYSPRGGLKARDLERHGPGASSCLCFLSL